MFENKKILILGAAKSGIAVAKLLSDKNNDIVLSDMKKLNSKDEEELTKLGIKIVISEHQEELLSQEYDVVIKNPAIMDTSIISKRIAELGLYAVNEMEVAYHYLPKNVTIIGVTGSNGKTTTTTMIYELLKRMHKNVVLGGNIGYPLCSVLNDIKENDILLLEISDHQLGDLKDFKTNISVLTNLCPTHLDYHGTYEHYMWTKAKIFAHHTNKDIAFLNEANQDSLIITKDINSHKIYFNNDDNYYNEEGIFIDKELIIKKEDILLKGNHNYENILAALLVINEYGIDKEIVKEFFQEFKGVEHRLEFVRNYHDVLFYNDSKATNPTATITALKTFQKPIHLILGGQERNQDFNELNDYLKYVKQIYAIGSVTERVEEYAKSQNIPVIKCYELSVAMTKIKDNIEAGDVVLLSTASSSQDQYAKFEDRGTEFKNYVANL